MQDIHSLGGGPGGGNRFLGVGGNGGDRRLRPHNHNHHHTPQAMKCPRCDSLNTKFCYYNNYNLSQPRHFCKSCRRYWTKGGVLRNVPVGGGCRKTKRTKPKTTSSNNSSASRSLVHKSSNSQNSSSDSSTVTEKTITTKTPETTLVTANPVFSFHETNTTGFASIPDPHFSLLNNNNNNNNNNNMFSEIGTFTSLITSSPTGQVSQIPLCYNDISPYRTGDQTEWIETEQQGIGEELKTNALGGFTEDWNNGTDHALFDDESYWNEAHWNDNDHDTFVN